MVYYFLGLVSALLVALHQRPAPIAGPSDRAARVQGATSDRSTETPRHVSGRVGFVAALALLVVAGGFRYGPGTDFWGRYVPAFQLAHTGRPIQMERGYLFINELVASVTDDFQWLFFVMSLLTVGLVFRFIRRMSVAPALSVFIFVIGGFYLEGFNLVRQALAIAILLNTIELVLRKKLGAFVIATAIAASLHSSALIWLVVWPAIRMRGGRAARVLGTISLAGAVVAAPWALQALVLRLAPDYAWYFDSNYGQVRAFDRTALPISLVIFAGLVFVSRRSGSRHEGLLLAVTTLQGIQLVAVAATETVAYAFSRITYYFTPIQMIAVPLLIASMPNRALRQLAGLVVLAVYTYAFYYKFVVWNAHEVLPYDFKLPF